MKQIFVSSNSGKEKTMEIFLVWWLSQSDYYDLSDEIRSNLPPYIAEEVSSREGRAGRGRLWIPQSIDLKEIDWSDDHYNARRIIANSAGGIVFRLKDFDKIKNLPGFVTDTKLDDFIG